MKHERPKITHMQIIPMLIAGWLCTSASHAQESVNAAGGDASGSNGSVAYSIGQVSYETHTGNAQSVAAGVQQAFEIFVVSTEQRSSEISLSAFPNPTEGLLRLEITKYDNEELTLHLYSTRGKLLRQKMVVSEQTQLDMTELPPATYLLHVSNKEGNSISSFRIIKN